MSRMAKRIANAVIFSNLEQRHFVPDIKVEIRRNYGTDHKYVISDHAEALTVLTGKKTVTDRDMQALKALGFTVYQQQKSARL